MFRSTMLGSLFTFRNGNIVKVAKFQRNLFRVIKRNLKVSCFVFAKPIRVPPSTKESAFPFFDPWFESSHRGTRPRTKSGSKYTVAMIPGVGIGKEMIETIIEVFDCCGARVYPEWIYDTSGDEALHCMKLALRRNGVAIKGNIEERSFNQIVTEDTENCNLLLQEPLDLFVNVTILKSFVGLEKLMLIHKKIDVIFVRSNTEGEFSLLEHELNSGAIEHLRIISAYNTRRVAEFAFQLAVREKRKKVTVLHQKFTMPMSEGLFVEEFLKVAKNYPTIKHEVLDVHTAISYLHRDMSPLDLIVSNSIYCSQLVDILIGLIGGPRLVAGGNFSDRYAIFEPSINSRSRGLVGKTEANPTAFLLCGAYALKYLGFCSLSSVIIDAIEQAFRSGVMTKDLGGNATTGEFVTKVIQHVQLVIPRVLCKYDKEPKLAGKPPKDWTPEKSKLLENPKKEDKDCKRKK